MKEFDIDAVWLAAFLDGEGTFTLSPFKRKNYKGKLTGIIGYTAVIAASSIDYKLVKRCQNIAGGWISPERTNSGNRKSSYRWSCKGPQVDIILPKIIPFLISKRRQAAILGIFRQYNLRGPVKGKMGTEQLTPEVSELNDQLKLAISSLNHRGKKEIPVEQISALNFISGKIEKFLSPFGEEFPIGR